MKRNKMERGIIKKVISGILVLSMALMDLSRAYGDVSPSAPVSALAPPLASKPPCYIVRHENGEDVEYEIVADDKVREFWEKETAAHPEEEARGRLKTGWMFVELQYIMAQALELGIGKNTLKKILSRYIETQGMTQAFSEVGYDIENIGQTREDELTALFIPVKRPNKPDLLLTYNRKPGGMEIDLAGQKIFMHVDEIPTDESQPETAAEENVKLQLLCCEIRNLYHDTKGILKSSERYINMIQDRLSGAGAEMKSKYIGLRDRVRKCREAFEALHAEVVEAPALDTLTFDGSYRKVFAIAVEFTRLQREIETIDGRDDFGDEMWKELCGRVEEFNRKFQEMVDAVSGPVKKTGADLNAIAMEVARIYGMGKEWTKMEWDISTSDDPAVKSYPTYYRSLLVYLFDNLIDNAHEHGFRDKAIPAGSRISVSLERSGGEVVARVRDNGKGMPQDALDIVDDITGKQRVFLPDYSESRRGKGSYHGLGLALSWEIVSALNGTITADSEPGKGAEFTVRLPVDTGAAGIDVTGGEEGDSSAKGPGIDDALDQVIDDLLGDAGRDDLFRMETDADEPMTFLMNSHAGSYKAWELARLSGRLKKPGVLVRFDAHRDMGYADLKGQPYTAESAVLRDYSNVGFTLPVVWYGLIDEIYLISPDAAIGTDRESEIYTAVDKETGRNVIYIPEFETSDVDSLNEWFTDIRPTGKKITIHKDHPPEKMPDLSKDDRPILLDVDMDYYFQSFGINENDVLRRRELISNYLGSMKRKPDILTMALSEETTLLFSNTPGHREKGTAILKQLVREWLGYFFAKHGRFYSARPVSSHAPVEAYAESRLHAEGLASFMKITQANSGTKLSFVALGRDWIDKALGDHEQKDHVNTLICAIRQRCEDAKIEFIYDPDGGDGTVVERVKELKAADRTARGFVLAGEDTIKGVGEALKKLDLEADDKVTLASVDPSGLTPDSFLRLAEMFEVLIELAAQPGAAESIRRSHPHLRFELVDGMPTRLVFIPSAEPLGEDIEEFRLRYRLQIAA